MRHFRRHAAVINQRRLRVDGLADVDRSAAHLDSQGACIVSVADAYRLRDADKADPRGIQSP